jgi:hypothetical protein
MTNLNTATDVLLIEQQTRAFCNKSITYRLSLTEQMFYNIEIEQDGKTICAPDITRDPTTALDFFHRIVNGLVTQEVFFELVDDFLAE